MGEEGSAPNAQPTSQGWTTVTFRFVVRVKTGSFVLIYSI